MQLRSLQATAEMRQKQILDTGQYCKAKRVRRCAVRRHSAAFNRNSTPFFSDSTDFFTAEKRKVDFNVLL